MVESYYQATKDKDFLRWYLGPSWCPARHIIILQPLRVSSRAETHYASKPRFLCPSEPLVFSLTCLIRMWHPDVCMWCERNSHYPLKGHVKVGWSFIIYKTFLKLLQQKRNIAASSSTTEEDGDFIFGWTVPLRTVKLNLNICCTNFACRRSALPGLEQEYRFWMRNRSVAVRLNGAEHVLNRYDVQVGLPR